MARLKVIPLTPAEVQSGMDRVRYAELLILQLPEDHDGRNTWLLNYGVKDDASTLRQKMRDGGFPIDEPTQARDIGIADADPELVQRLLTMRDASVALGERVMEGRQRFLVACGEMEKSYAMMLAASEWAPAPSRTKADSWLDKHYPERRGYPSIGALWSDLTDEQRERYLERARVKLGLSKEDTNGENQEKANAGNQGSGDGAVPEPDGRSADADRVSTIRSSDTGSP